MAAVAGAQAFFAPRPPPPRSGRSFAAQRQSQWRGAAASGGSAAIAAEPALAPQPHPAQPSAEARPRAGTAQPGLFFEICLTSNRNLNDVMSSADHAGEPRSERLLRSLAKKVRECAKQIDTASVLVDDVEQTLGDLAKQHSGLGAVLPPSKPKSRPSDQKDPPEVAYARSVALKWISADSLEAVVDGRRVELPRTLGLLLELLVARDGTATAQARFGWKKRSELRLEMAEKTGRKVKPHAFENQLSRLRKALSEQAGLGGLIRCDGRLHVRFARQEDVAAEEGASLLARCEIRQEG
jgi:hypothetical protein